MNYEVEAVRQALEAATAEGGDKTEIARLVVEDLHRQEFRLTASGGSSFDD